MSRKILPLSSTLRKIVTMLHTKLRGVKRSIPLNNALKQSSCICTSSDNPRSPHNQVRAADLRDPSAWQRRSRALVCEGAKDRKEPHFSLSNSKSHHVPASSRPPLQIIFKSFLLELTVSYFACTSFWIMQDPSPAWMSYLKQQHHLIMNYKKRIPHLLLINNRSTRNHLRLL
jgi:hypothetical protein